MMKKEEKAVRNYSGIYRSVIRFINPGKEDRRVAAYRKRLTAMYASEKYKKHNVYPTMDVTHIYAVIAMCLELKKLGLSDRQIIEAVNKGFQKRRDFFRRIIRFINILPNSYDIARKWNINDHAKRVKDGSITYDYFKVSKDKVKYHISKCMYVEMFAEYGIRGLCKIFCMTDTTAYEGLTKHVKFIRHSDLSDGEACFDEVIRKKKQRR